MAIINKCSTVTLGSHVSQALTVKTVAIQNVYAFIEAPHVSEQAFRNQLEYLMTNLRTYEGGPLGFLIVLSKREDADNMIGAIMNTAMDSFWKGKALSYNDGLAAQLLLLDGGTMLDCKTGTVEATTIHFASNASCPFFIAGRGTKHQSAVNLSFNWDVVILVRSVDSSDITIFASALTRKGQVACVSASASGTPKNTVADDVMMKLKEKTNQKKLFHGTQDMAVKSSPSQQGWLVLVAGFIIWVQAVQGTAISFLLCSRFMRLMKAKP